MGMLISSLSRRITKDKRLHLLLFGLAGAGKSTMLFRLKWGGIYTSIPTEGFNVEQVEYTNITFTICDVAGSHRICALDENYFRKAAAVIYVVDSSDVGRIEESCEKLHEILNHPFMSKTTLLVFANKQDVSNSMNTADLTERLRLDTIRGRDWHIQPSNAETCDGVLEGLRWLEENLRNKK